MTNSELTLKARAIARNLTYNEDTPQAEAKHMLLELAHRLDSQSVRAHEKVDGLLLVNGVGKARYATLKERIIYRLFGVLPQTI